MALRVSEMCFWPAKSESILNFLRFMHVLTWCSFFSEINEGIGIQFRFYFFILVNIVASFIRMSFFSFCGSGFWIEVFSYCSVTETSAIRFQNWFDRKWKDFGFFAEICLVFSPSYLYALKSALIAQVCFLFDDIKSFRWLVWGVFWSVL